ncbi:filamentous hemagglutinin N-terminal domain-containing protein [Calothrix sp. FACHB-156]|nr:filamentous hemagglutinin N-terminal domain-containing protein [Calothrix sp. FACHB-156]
MVPAPRQQLWQLRLLNLLAICGVFIVWIGSARAQITPDGTLGAESATLKPNATVQGLPTTLIEGGATRGVNLFQSFLQFNVGDGQRIYFANPAGIENILTRVTGSDPSKIFGTLGVYGTANLFLLNPNGIIFGPNARLDVAGSFLATTANSFVFENGLNFSATNPAAAPLLTVSIRPGLQFGTNHSASISNNGNLTAGQDLSLIASNLDLQGRLQAGKDLTLQAQDTAKLRDTTANPLIVAAGGNLLLQGNQNIDIFALNRPESGLFAGGDMVLRSANTVGGDAHYWSGGNFRIEKLDSSLGKLSSPYDPIIRASGDVSFESYDGASLHIFAGGSVNIDSIYITGADITAPENSITEDVPLSTTLPDGTNFVSIQGGTEPTLDIRAGTTAFATPGLTPNPILDLIGTVNTNAPSTNADINISWIENLNSSPEGEFINGKILLTNQYAPNNLPGKIITGQIDAFGDVIIDSRGDIRTHGNIDTSSYIEEGGDINLLARGTLSLDNVFVKSEAFGIGNAGDITVKAQSVFLNHGAQLRSISQRSGDAGNINVYVRDILSLSGNGDQEEPATPSAIFTLAGFRHSTGNGGDINISTNSLIMKDGAEILANNFGSGDNTRAGNINIRATGKISLDGFRVRPNNDNSGTGIASNVSFFGNDKKAGIIDIQAASLDLTNSAYIASTLETGLEGHILSGKGGNIKLDIIGDILLSGEGKAVPSTISALTQSNTIGDGGKIEVKAGGNISLSNRATIKTDNNGSGYAGSISAIAGNTFSVDNSSITSESNNNNLDSHSAIYIEAPKGSVFLNQARISTTNFGLGYAGDIIISAHNEVSILNSSTFNPANEIKGIFSNGYLGNIYIGLTQDNSLIPQKVTFDHSFLTTSNYVVGKNQQEILGKDAGSIIIKSLGELSLSSSNLEAATYGSGSGGYIDITANSVFLSNQSSFLADTLGTGKAGSVIVNATGGSVSLSESSINTGTNQLISDLSKLTQIGKGGGGDIKITADYLSLTKNSYLNASTIGSGNSGNFSITVGKTVSFTDSSILNARTYKTGNAGDINIKAQSISLSNESLIQAETFGSGNAGSLDITAQFLSFSNTSRIDAQTFGSGNAGNINIKTQSLSLTEGSRINADTRSSGQGGSININPWNEQNQPDASVNISGYALINKFSSGLFVNTESTETNAGTGGNINIRTGTLSISDGGVLSAPSKSSGDGGDINVNVNNLEITGGGQILTNAYRSGAAGNIKINATDNITISGQDFTYQERLNQLIALISNIKDNYDFVLPGNQQEAKRILGSINQYSGLFANTEIDSTGQGGTINIDPKQVTIKDSARISVDSQGSGVAGSISITADRLTLDTQANITADTDSGQGGSITLNLQDLLLFRRQSFISTTAGRQGAGGDGGAIAIKLNSNNGFIVSPALENNDIEANAFSGSGGTIEIDAKGVIGLATLTRQELEQKLGTTDPEKLDPQSLQTNDITAISQTDPQLNGVISISSPDIDPSKGIVSLPTNASDPSQQIAQNCGAGDEKTAGQFTDVGRGGLPPKPDELLSTDTVWEDIRLSANSLQTRSSSYSTTSKPAQQKAVLIMPATGWVLNDQGDVTLVSQTPKTAASWLNSSSCAVKK